MSLELQRNFYEDQKKKKERKMLVWNLTSQEDALY